MSSVALAVENRRSATLTRVADYFQLSKPRIAALELIVVAVAMYVGATRPTEVSLVVATLVGTGLIAASASAANQWWERLIDARMHRTEDRPLPAGRVTAGEALAFAAISLVLGAAGLALWTTWICLLSAIATWFIYVVLYTPLKRRSPANTAVGAVAGALPVLIGWSAVGGAWDLRLAALLTILFLWQFPHFMAIAWLYRREYAGVGLRMLTVVDPTGMRAACQAVLGAALLLPVSLVPVVYRLEAGSLWYAAWALALGAGQLVPAIQFLIRRNDAAARLLLRASLIYLPSLLTILVVVHGLSQVAHGN